MTKNSTIQKVAIIGSGVMGSGIAAQIANAGFEALLLDIVPEGAKDRSVLAKTALATMLKTAPAPFMHKRNAKLVTPGNLEDDLEKLADADWIIEVVVERKDIKQALYTKIDKVRKKGSLVSSNTSTIPLKDLIAGQSAYFAKDFMVTHFFNPPRYMRLLEVVKGDQTDQKQFDRACDFADRALGKGVVQCKDSPAFIANRIGIFWMQACFNTSVDMGLSVEEVDQIMSRPFGIPKTGVFGLADLVGLDLMPYLAVSLKETLPKNDLYQGLYRDWPLLQKMIADGYTGRKGKGGFYRLDPEAKGQKVKQAINLQTGVYENAARPVIASLALAKTSLKDFLDSDDKAGQFAKKVFTHLMHYVLTIREGVADDMLAVDTAMRLGYNWKFGPFELIDRVGVEWLKTACESEGLAWPKALGVENFYKIEEGQLYYLATPGEYKTVERAEGVLLLKDLKLKTEPVLKNASASVWDIGDGVLCFEFHSKMNSVDDQIIALLGKTIKLIEGSDDYKALVIHNEGSQFSVGVNLGMVIFMINLGLWAQVEAAVEQGQEVYQKLKYAPFPVVGAPAGMALGGGCEVLLHCDAVCAHAETYTGLVEVGVGVIPGWGGCKELLRRWDEDPKAPKGPMAKVMKAFETISVAKVSTSAQEAYDAKFLRRGIDEVCMNKDRLLFEAKEKALRMVKGYQPPEAHVFSLPGDSGSAAIEMAVGDYKKVGMVMPHDEIVMHHLADTLTGSHADMTDEVSEKDVLKLEVQNIMQLFKTQGTLARIEHMLETGRPLRN